MRLTVAQALCLLLCTKMLTGSSQYPTGRAETEAQDIQRTLKVTQQRLLLTGSNPLAD